jgi:hypothetical protein
MADVNKSIEIKKMPGMSEQEAKKMVSQLDRQLKQAEKAAQRTGKNTARGMREVDRATKIATNSMRQFRTAGRNADRIFGELSTGLELVSPELGAMAGFASQASSGIEALGRAIGGANPMLLAITVAAAGAALAYQFFSVDAKEVEEQAKKTTEKRGLSLVCSRVKLVHLMPKYYKMSLTSESNSKPDLMQQKNRRKYFVTRLHWSARDKKQMRA